MAKGQDTGNHPGRKVGREEYRQGVWKGIPDANDIVNSEHFSGQEGPYGLMSNEETGETFVHGPYGSDEEAMEANHGHNTAYDYGEVTHMGVGRKASK